MRWGMLGAVGVVGAVLLVFGGITIGGYYLGNALRVDRMFPKETFEPDSDFEYVSYAIAPDGKQIVFASTKGDLYLYSFADKKIIRLTTTPEREYSPAFSPDGKWIVYVSARQDDYPSHLRLMSMDGKVTRDLTTDPNVADTMPSFSPDGQMVVFSRSQRLRTLLSGAKEWQGEDIFTIRVDGTGKTQLTKEDYDRVSDPCFLNESTILYSDVQPHGKSGSLWIVGTTPGKPTLFWEPPVQKRPTEGTTLTGLSLSSDRQTIAFVADLNVPRSYQVDVHTLDVSTKKLRTLKVSKASDYNLETRFSSDGRVIYFMGADRSNYVPNSQPYNLYKVVQRTGKVDLVVGHKTFDR